MKKTLLVFLALALVGSFAFAEVTGVDAPTVTGSVTTTFGYDLDLEASGFDNDADVEITVPLAGGSDTHSGSGGAYAEITVTDIDISFSTDNNHDVGYMALDPNAGDTLETEVNLDADVSAKLVFGDIWVGLNSPDFDFNNVDQEDDDDVNLVDLAKDGISVGYTTDAYSLAIQIASAADGYIGDKDDDSGAYDGTDSWTDSETEDSFNDNFTANTENDYAFGVVASVMAGPATVPVSFAYYADNYMGFGAAPSIVVGPATINIPVDYVSELVTKDYGFEMDPSVAVVVDGVGTITADFFFAKYDIASFSWEQEMNVGVLYEEDFMDGYVMTLEASVNDLGEEQGDMTWDVDMTNSFDLGGMAPYVNFGYDEAEALDLSVGVVFATAIDNATVTLDYSSDDVADFDNNKGLATISVAVVY